METHVIKETHNNGEELPRHKQRFWCGSYYVNMDVVFVDAQHVLLSTSHGDCWGHPVCRKCLEAMKHVIDIELDTIY